MKGSFMYCLHEESIFDVSKFIEFCTAVAGVDEGIYANHFYINGLNKCFTYTVKAFIYHLLPEDDYIIKNYDDLGNITQYIELAMDISEHLCGRQKITEDYVCSVLEEYS